MGTFQDGNASFIWNENRLFAVAPGASLTVKVRQMKQGLFEVASVLDCPDPCYGSVIRTTERTTWDVEGLVTQSLRAFYKSAMPEGSRVPEAMLAMLKQDFK